MKCHLFQKSKHRLSTADKKKLQGKINEYMKLSIIYGHEKALEILKQRKESEVEGEWKETLI